MCGRFTYTLTWEEIIRLYRLPLDHPPQNTQPRYNICPTTTVDTITEREALAHANALGPCARLVV
jgi:putative SOS response-associated peptidase YedK